MRKIIKRPDGTEEVIEGTPEEIAEYERKLKKESSLKKPGILKDEVDRLKKLIEESKEPPPSPNIYRRPLWVVSCSICNRIGCGGGCYASTPWYTITCAETTTLGDSVAIADTEANRDR